jgi:hypothetical protein
MADKEHFFSPDFSNHPNSLPIDTPRVALCKFEGKEWKSSMARMIYHMNNVKLSKESVIQMIADLDCDRCIARFEIIYQELDE